MTVTKKYATKKRKVHHDHSYLDHGEPLVVSQQVNSQRSDMSSPARVSGFTVDKLQEEHSYDFNRKSDVTVFSPKTAITTAVNEMEILKRERDMLLETVISLKNEKLLPPKNALSYEMLANRDHLVKVYTGLPSYACFTWLFSQVETKAQSMQYYSGTKAHSEKMYQTELYNKPGASRTASQKNEMLMTLMRLRLDLLLDDLAFRFEVSSTCVSRILSTWIPFLGFELKPLIAWPSPTTIFNHYPRCFESFGTVIGIIDCTEVYVEKPSLAESNSQFYSSYKQRTTVKILIGCSPCGSICYVSSTSTGAMSDKEIVKKSDFLEQIEKVAKKFDGQVTLLADRGFNIQELLLPYDVKLEVPPFTENKQQFPVAKSCKTKAVANARIHIERSIGRVKEFKILQGVMPLDYLDLLDHIFTICSGIVNLQPTIIPM